MLKKWTSSGNPVLLFDRLTDHNLEEKTESPPLVNYTKEEFLNSIALECSHILNTRCKIPYKAYQEMDAATFAYGVPELYGFMDNVYEDPSSYRGAALLVKFMGDALKRFESRLQESVVKIEGYNQSDQTLALTVTGNVLIKDVVESFSFPLKVESVRRAVLVPAALNK